MLIRVYPGAGNPKLLDQARDVMWHEGKSVEL
jgi:hypothetical protein